MQVLWGGVGGTGARTDNEGERPGSQDISLQPLPPNCVLAEGGGLAPQSGLLPESEEGTMGSLPTASHSGLAQVLPKPIRNARRCPHPHPTGAMGRLFSTRPASVGI